MRNLSGLLIYLKINQNQPESTYFYSSGKHVLDSAMQLIGRSGSFYYKSLFIHGAVE
jgi:hypothetical protein